jgi:hypothetical protein
MTLIVLQKPGLHGAGQRTHILFVATDLMPSSALHCDADLTQVKHQRAYLPQGTPPWPSLRRPTRKTNHAKFRSEP